MKALDFTCPDWLTHRPIAHRGLHDASEAPENSMLAFERAMAQDYPIELDLRISADGEVVVFHDETTDRCTGVSGCVDRMSLEELRRLRLFGTEQRIPTLFEVLGAVAGRVPLLIEIKRTRNTQSFEEQVWSLLRSYLGEYAVQSFHPGTVAWFSKNAPDACIGLLAGDFSGSDLSWWEKFALQNLLLVPALWPEFIAYEVSALPSMPASIVRRAFGIPLIAWTVRNEADLERARRHADGIIFEGLDGVRLQWAAGGAGGPNASPELAGTGP